MSQELKPQSRQRALQEASDWLLRLQDEHIGEDTLDAWSRWLAASPEHGRAFDDLQALWDASAALDSESVLRARHVAAESATAGAATPAMRAPAQSRRHRQRPARRWALGLAATLALAAAGLAVFMSQAPRTVTEQRFATAIGERAQWTLNDGSTLSLDAGSEAVVRLAPERREVVLRSGQAFFAVASAPGRPFAVEAGRVRSEVLGTRFAVAHRASGAVTVTVEEGRVHVAAPSQAAQDRAGQTLSTGQQVRYAPATGLQASADVDDAQALSWREGSVVYRGEMLADVIEDLNRYSRVPIRLQDPSLGKLKVTGRWDLAGIDPWLDGLARALQLEVQRGPDAILLVQSGAWKNRATAAPVPETPSPID